MAWLWWWWPVWPLAVAAQVPPTDFPGALFIDASGCVRERVGTDWLPRLLADGHPDCGYPPTPLPKAPARASDLPLPPGLPEAEGRLLVTLAEGVRAGDFQPPVPRTEPAPVPHPALDMIEAAISAEGMLARVLVAGNVPNARLCALLGQDAASAGALGTDPTRGFCPGDGGPQLVAAALRPAASLTTATRGNATGSRIDRPPAAGASDPPPPVARPHLAPVAAVGDGGAGAVRDPPAARAGRAAPAVAVAAGSSAAVPPGSGDPVVPQAARLPRPVAAAAAMPARSVPAPGPAPGPGMIPAGSRYLQLGGQTDPAAAMPILTRVAGLGLPVARGRVPGGDGILILVGPFDSRENLVRAHDRLRAAGFAGMTAW